MSDFYPVHPNLDLRKSAALIGIIGATFLTACGGEEQSASVPDRPLPQTAASPVTVPETPPPTTTPLITPDTQTAQLKPPIAAPSPGGDPSVIALDPGHGPNHAIIDPATGLKQVETKNQPEMAKVWEVALRVKNSLKADGYKVVMLKKSVDEDITFRQRAERADQAHADLAVSIHGDPTLPNTGQIYPQKVGLYRGKGNAKTVFTNKLIADASQRYSQYFKTERQKVVGPDVVVTTVDFKNRRGFDPGNIPMVQLFSETPWVYNEEKMPFKPSVYSYSLVEAIEHSVPPIR